MHFSPAFLNAAFQLHHIYLCLAVASEKFEQFSTWRRRRRWWWWSHFLSI